MGETKGAKLLGECLEERALPYPRFNEKNGEANGEAIVAAARHNRDIVLQCSDTLKIKNQRDIQTVITQTQIMAKRATLFGTTPQVEGFSKAQADTLSQVDLAFRFYESPFDDSNFMAFSAETTIAGVVLGIAPFIGAGIVPVILGGALIGVPTAMLVHALGLVMTTK